MSYVSIDQSLIVAWSHLSAKSILIICITNMSTSPPEFCQGEETKFDRRSECTRRAVPSIFRHYESDLRIYFQTYESIYLFHAKEYSNNNYVQ